ncbi:MAG: Cof-like hydrolase [Herbinix sp.]|jgi:Cof subfamily protein (haloacid dehalogenase superfamily)|nr:Cof-like hydrolase [Herbinix sp.]
MSYELLFLDVDGTLKQEPEGISDVNKEAILKACRAGKIISVASGRNRDLIMNTVKELRLNEFGDTYTVALNGAHIIENKTGRTLHTVPISMELVTFLFQKAYEHKVSCHVYTENYIYFNYHDIQFEWYKKNGGYCELVNMGNLDLGIKEVPLKFYFYSKNTKRLLRIFQESADIVNGSLNGEFSSKYSLEYTSIHASKGLGMEYVCNLFQMNTSRAIAAGDGENDISMIKMAGLGIAMKNALDTVKAEADTVTKRTCMENGVAEIILEHLLV